MTREISYLEGIREALGEEMERDERVFLMGEDIGVYGGAFGVTRGLLDRFGPDRVRETPISEASLLGITIGCAMTGLRPILEIMFMDFATLIMDQMLNHAAKFHYVYDGQFSLPLVVRTPGGGGRGYGATHSQMLEGLFLKVPGLKIVAPWSPADAKGLLTTAIRDDNPVLFVEHKLLYGVRGEVPEEQEGVGFGQAAIRRQGRDVTLISYSYGVTVCLEAARRLASEGVECEVVDLRTLNPLDTDTILSSCGKTHRAVIVEEGTKTGGVGAEIGMRVVEEGFWHLEAPPRRVAAADTPIPASPHLERVILPSADDVIAAVSKVL